MNGTFLDHINAMQKAVFHKIVYNIKPRILCSLAEMENTI